MKRKITLIVLAVLLIMASYAQTGYYRLEVGFIKTTHITFPAKVKYVDLGSNYLIAGTADETDNVVRVKAAYKGFKEETNFSVICEDGSFYTFLVTYRDQPEVLYHEMSRQATLTDQHPVNTREVIFKDIEGESPAMLSMILRSLYIKNEREITHLGERGDQIEATLRGIYVHNDIMYFNLSLRNKSNISYDVDYIRFSVQDMKKLKKTASQTSVVSPVREYNGERTGKAVPGTSYRTVLAFRKFTIAPEKILMIEIAEKHGGRNINFFVTANDIIDAQPVKSIVL